MGRLDGKVALVTGGARGIGADSASTLAREGAKVMVSDVEDDPGEQTARGIRDDGGEAAYTHLDTTAEAQWPGAIAATVDTFGGLDVLVNNAGIEVVKPLMETTLEDLQRISAINEHGVYLGIQHAVTPMTERGGGSIINLSSVAGMQGFMALTAYCMTKGGVRLLTKAAAVELGRTGTNIRVNSIHPGVIETRMADALYRGVSDYGWTSDQDDAKTRFTARHPIGRLGETTDIANLVLFLASDESAFITGEEHVIDGGLTAE